MQYEIRNYAPAADAIRIDFTEGKQLTTVHIRRSPEGLVTVTVESDDEPDYERAER
jgi:hypothetical protein